LKIHFYRIFQSNSMFSNICHGELLWQPPSPISEGWQWHNIRWSNVCFPLSRRRIQLLD